MNYLDGKNNLKRTMLKKLMQSESTEIMLMYTDIHNNEIAEEYSKDNIFENVFCEKVYDNINDETVVTLATDDLAIETLKVDIGWWMKPVHFKKLDELLSTKPKQTKAKVEVKEKMIAVGRFEEQIGKVYDVYAFEVSNDKIKEAVSWLNEKIEYYKLHKCYEKLRVCLDYSTSSSRSLEGWFTIEELLEKGLVKI